MNITGGLARGLRIETPPGSKTRPTTNRVRESLFAILRDLIPGSQVIDLYAGSGSLGLEAASRGAERVLWVEKHPAAAALIRQNFARLAPAGVKSEGSVFIEEVGAWLRAPGVDAADLIFADPPYDLMRDAGGLLLLLGGVMQSQILKPEGIMVLEVGKGTPADLPAPWSLLRREEYGSSELLFLDYSD